MSQRTRLLPATMLSVCKQGLLSMDSPTADTDACIECMRSSASRLRQTGNMLRHQGDADACMLDAAGDAAVCDCVLRLAYACGSSSKVQVPVGGQKLLFCCALALVDAWAESPGVDGAGQPCETATNACIEAFSGAGLFLHMVHPQKVHMSICSMLFPVQHRGCYSVFAYMFKF